jgi:ribosomal protein S18 acetylase RimI-like enzyme
VTAVCVRPATSEDVEEIIDVICGEPGDDAIALMGTTELAQEYRKRIVELERIPNSSRPTVVAQAGDRVVGLLQYRIGEGGRHGALAHLRVLTALVGPIGVVRRAPRLWARTRVGLAIPPDSFYITNVHVASACRGKGVGGELLDWAEQAAITSGVSRMTLTTVANGPAIPLYERHGFRITATAAHPTYERQLHVAGRVLMEKWLER